MFPLIQLGKNLMGCLPRLMTGRMCSLSVWGGYTMNMMFPKGASFWPFCILFRSHQGHWFIITGIASRIGTNGCPPPIFFNRPWAYWAHTTTSTTRCKRVLFQLACSGCAFLGRWFQHSSVHGQQCMKGIYVQDGGITGWTLARPARVTDSKWNLGVYGKCPS